MNMKKILIICSVLFFSIFLKSNLAFGAIVRDITDTVDDGHGNKKVVTVVNACASLKDKGDDVPYGSDKKPGEFKRGDSGARYGYSWTSWDDFCDSCPNETCCGKNKTCDCPCSTNYCAKDDTDGKVKCMPYAKSCGCNQYSQGMVCGKTPAGKISCSYGTSFQYQCKS
jgi:hypothetical protein